MPHPHSLPPGQRAIDEFPRFGITEFAKRPIPDRQVHLQISGAIEQPVVLTASQLATIPRMTLAADFHCAAGWSYRNLRWSGFRFQDVWEALILPHTVRSRDIGYVVLRGQDRYRTSLALDDLLAPDVILADRLNDEPLTLAHGAPLRLVAPAHYGYKSAKHLNRIDLRFADEENRPVLPRVLDHPRARVALEERGQFLPGWLLRYMFRPFIQPLIRKMRRISEEHPVE
jgi:DMSO/TMAO reductase YedYZ molybdopterin-dependent catalytic subunit